MAPWRPCCVAWKSCEPVCGPTPLTQTSCLQPRRQVCVPFRPQRTSGLRAVACYRHHAHVTIGGGDGGGDTPCLPSQLQTRLLTPHPYLQTGLSQQRTLTVNISCEPAATTPVVIAFAQLAQSYVADMFALLRFHFGAHTVAHAASHALPEMLLLQVHIHSAGAVVGGVPLHPGLQRPQLRT